MLHVVVRYGRAAARPQNARLSTSLVNKGRLVWNLLQVTLLAYLPIYAMVFQSGLSPSRFPTKILFAYPSLLPVLATWPLIWSLWWYLVKSINDFRKWGGGMGCIVLAQDRDTWRALVNAVMNVRDLQMCWWVLNPTRLKKQLKGRHISSNAEVIATAETWLDGQPSDFFLSVLQKLVWSL